MEIIHNKAIFDAFNEALDHFRPHSVHGMPYPWKINPKTLPRTIEEDDIDEILQNTAKKVFQWSKYRAGLFGNDVETTFDEGLRREDTISNMREEANTNTITNDVNYHLRVNDIYCL